MNDTLGQLTLAFPRLLSEETLTVLIRFNYTLSQGLSGFYRSQYTGKHTACTPRLLCLKPQYYAYP